jgi:hypothetical protein
MTLQHLRYILCLTATFTGLVGCTQPDLITAPILTTPTSDIATNIPTPQQAAPVVATPSEVLSIEQQGVQFLRQELQRTDLNAEERRLFEGRLKMMENFRSLTPAPEDYTPDELRELEMYRQGLQQPDLTAEQQRWYEARIETIEETARGRMIGRAYPAPKPANPQLVLTPIPAPTAALYTLPPGIMEPLSPPFGSATVKLTNMWRDNATGVWISAYAGALKSDLQQGVLIFLPDGPTSQEWYNTPTKAGSVTIVAAQNQQLTLQGENGDTFIFDIPSRQFVAPDGTLIAPGPTFTPAPTETPAPTATPTM